MIRSSSPVLLTALALGASSLPAVAGISFSDLGRDAAPDLLQLAQFDPPDNRPAPLTADGGGARFSVPDRSAPEGASGGATRNSCVSMVPIVPKDAGGAYYGQTVSASPELYFYTLRADETEAESATLFVYKYSASGEQAFNADHTQSFALPTDTRTIVRVEIDEDSGFEFEPGEQYEWFVEIECSPGSNDPTTLAFSQGWIERVDLETVDIGTDIETGEDSTNDAAAIYGEQGIWYEYLNTLIAADSANWSYILDGLSDAIDDSVDLSGATLVPDESNDNVQIIQP